MDRERRNLWLSSFLRLITVGGYSWGSNVLADVGCSFGGNFDKCRPKMGSGGVMNGG